VEVQVIHHGCCKRYTPPMKRAEYMALLEETQR
jgi:hypothetical protein